MNIYGKKVILRAMEPYDNELVVNMFNDPELEKLVVGWSFPISVYGQGKWLEHHYNDDRSFRFIIEVPDEGSVGIATLVDIDWKNRMAQHGIKIAKNLHRGSGIGTDTVMAIMRYAFDELGLNRLNGSWFNENEASRRLYMKCGWKEEGIRRKCIYQNGSYHDLVLTGVLSTDYYRLIETTNYWENK